MKTYRLYCMRFIVIFFILSSNITVARDIVFATSIVRGSVMHQVAVEFVNRLNANLKNGARVVFYDSGKIGDDTQLMWMLSSGSIQITLPSSIMSSFVEEFAIFDLPFFIQSREHMVLIEENLLPFELSEAAQKKGYYVLALWENGFRHISNNVRPIIKPSDLQGLRIRTPKSTWRQKIFTNWGAESIKLAFSQVYGAIRNGIVDGQENPLSNIWNARLHGIQKYVSISGHVYSPAFLTISKRWFDQLDIETQLIIVDTAKEMSDYSRLSGEKEDGLILGKLEDSGVFINNIDRDTFVRSTKPIYRDLINAIPSVSVLIEKVESLKPERAVHTN